MKFEKCVSLSTRQAPFKASGMQFAIQSTEQGSDFFQKFWYQFDFRALLLEHLFGFSEALSMFTRTCQAVRQGVEEQLVCRH